MSRWPVAEVRADGKKVCTRCKLPKDKELFAKNKSQKSGYDTQCLQCHCEKQQLRREQGLDVETRRRRELRKRYGITPEDWDRMYDAQLGRCPICLITLAEVKKVCVDHDHETGAVRGILCFQCNLGIGSLKDNIDALERAAEYLRPFVNTDRR
jgi:hypothetical protein